MADIVDVLISDHDAVRKLFEEFTVAPSDDERERIVRKLVRTLSQHDSAEELVVWPAASKAGLDRLVDDRLREERELREELHFLDRKTAVEPDFQTQVARVQALVQGHVSEEEGEAFPRLRGAIDASQRERLARDYVAAREAAPTRPHPLAPSRPPGLTVAAAASAPLDRMRDRIRGTE